MSNIFNYIIEFITMELPTVIVGEIIATLLIGALIGLLISWLIIK